MRLVAGTDFCSHWPLTVQVNVRKQSGATTSWMKTTCGARPENVCFISQNALKVPSVRFSFAHIFMVFTPYIELGDFGVKIF